MRCSLPIRLRKVKCSSWIRLKSPSSRHSGPVARISPSRTALRGAGMAMAPRTTQPAPVFFLRPTTRTLLQPSNVPQPNCGTLVRYAAYRDCMASSRTHRQPLAMPLLGLGIWRHGLVAHKDLQSPQTVTVQRAVPIVVYPPAGPSRSRRDGGTRPARLCRLLWSLVFRRLFRLSRDSCRIRLQRDGRTRAPDWFQQSDPSAIVQSQ